MVLIDFAYLRPSTNSNGKRERESDGILGTDILTPLKAVLDYERMLLVLKIDPRVPGPFRGSIFAVTAACACAKARGSISMSMDRSTAKRPG